MILGTVELGLAYGINNVNGKPSYEKSYSVLEHAWQGGVRELDTAASYGDSEQVIGLYQEKSGNYFNIDTKLPVSISNKQLMPAFEESCQRLKCSHINLLYLHSFEQCKNPIVIDFLKELKNQKRVEHIGISIYEPSEMEYIIQNLPFIDVIQFPYNILDHARWKENDLLTRTKRAGKKLYARSVYLQGLLFRSPLDPLIQKMEATNYIEALQQLSEKEHLSIPELALKYVLCTEEIDDIILGCESPNDVINNLALLEKINSITSPSFGILEERTSQIPQTIIDPRTWRNI